MERPLIEKLPKFIIIGAQRCGTTSMYNYLIQHPKIIPAKRKEIHFFDNNFNNGLSWYYTQFDSKNESLTGEATPYYIYHPHAIKRISKIFPEIKIIVLLRSPVNRAYSHYHHECRLGVEKLSFDDAINDEKTRLKGEIDLIKNDENYYSFNHQHFSYLDRGFYYNQLKTCFKFFPKSQFKIIQSEKFYEKTQTEMNDVFNFLGLESIRIYNFEKFKNFAYPPINEEAKVKLEEKFEKSNERLYSLLDWEEKW